MDATAAHSEPSTDTSPAARSPKKRRPPPMPGCDALGRTYDVFGYYADPRSVKLPILREDYADSKAVEVDGTTWSLPNTFSFTLVRATEKQTVCELTQDAYSSRLAASVNLSASYGLFSASLESQFSTSMSAEGESCYTSIFVNVYKWQLRLVDNVAAWRERLTPSFKKDLENLEPTDLFDRYGTHFLNEVVVGGRANYLAVTKMKKGQTTSEVRIAADAAYGKKVGISASAEMELKITGFNESSYTQSNACGGSAMTDIQDEDQFNLWVESIDQDPIFCAFTHDSLLPIFVLAGSDKRRLKLQDATDVYVPPRIRQRVLAGLDVIVSRDKDVRAPKDYIKINRNLNEGNEGKYIYLCYRKQNTSVSGGESIFDIDVSPKAMGGDSRIVTIRQDLNDGSGGVGLYLNYSTHADLKLNNGRFYLDRDLTTLASKFSIPPLPIRTVGVIFSGEDIPYGFEKYPVDLNMGAKGEHIYIIYSREVDE